MPDAVTRPAPRPQPASQPRPASQPEIRPAGSAAGTRLAWLDALRGIAALCVVFALSAMIVLWASGIGSLGVMDSDAT